MKTTAEFGIDLYRGADGNRQGLQFDVQAVMAKLKDAFPSITFEDEYYTSQLALMRRTLAGHAGAVDAISQAERDSTEKGPRFGFLVSLDGSEVLGGGISRYCIAFRTGVQTPPTIVANAEEFVRAFSLPTFRTGDDSAPQAPSG